MGYNAFKDDERYNPKYGINGRVQDDEFSIDGRSWNYRDPKNPESNSAAIAARSGDDGSAEDDWSQNAKLYANPLYDYSYGQVRDAAKELNISNVNDEDEVNQIINRIRSGPKTEEKTKEKAETDPKEFLDKYINDNVASTQAEVEIPLAQNSGTTSGDGSLNSSIAQANAQIVSGNNNTVGQNNAISQSMNNKVNNSDNSTRMFLDDYKLNLGSKLNLRTFA